MLNQDFVFHPGFLALWPGKTGEVEVTLRSRGVGKYSALLEDGLDGLDGLGMTWRSRNLQEKSPTNGGLFIFRVPFDLLGM